MPSDLQCFVPAPLNTLYTILDTRNDERASRLFCPNLLCVSNSAVHVHLCLLHIPFLFIIYRKKRRWLTEEEFTYR